MKTQKVGDWGRAFKVVNSLPNIIAKENAKFLETVGKKGVGLLRFHIDNNDLPWRPLSEAYLEQKRSEGYSSNIWKRSQDLYDSLKFEVVKKGSGSGVFMGVPKGEQTETGDQMTDIAKIHEFGALSAGIYERPLFRPTLEELKEWFKNVKHGQNVVKELKRI